MGLTGGLNLKTLFLFLLLSSFSNLTWAARKPRPPITYDITRLVQKTSPLRLLGGKTLSLEHEWKQGAKVLFKDLHPGANWSHPALYQVIAPNGKILEETKAKLPPSDLSEAPILPEEEADEPLPIPRRMEIKLNDFKGAMKIKETSRHHALLINGHAEMRHWNDFSFLFQTLTKIYGYSSSQIYVADSVNKESFPDLDGDGTPDIHYASTTAGIKTLVGELKEKLKKEDYLLIVVNDHGIISQGESSLLLHDGEIKASEFSKILAELPTEKVLSVYEQCFSGGFVRPSVSGRRAAMSAASNVEFSWATEDANFDEFLYYVITAFARQTHNGTPVQSDLNGDNRISAQEAFSFALGRDQAPESPLMESSANAGSSLDLGVAYEK